MNFEETVRYIQSNPGITREEVYSLGQGILLMAETEHTPREKLYTIEEKINNLIGLAKAAGRYIEQGGHTETDYGKHAYDQLKAYYDAFCEWRHDEPALNSVMTIETFKALIGRYDELSATLWEDQEHHQERLQELERIRETFAVHGLVIGLGTSKTIVTLPDDTGEHMHD